jgi:thymidylate synthase (FAD)
MIVRLIARPQFVALPPELGVPRPDQVLGPDAQRIIETAARCCYDSFGKGRDSDGHARHILDVGHTSVLEHAQYTFFIGGVSRGFSHEHVRHRIGVAISQRSTRYVDEESSPWIKHPLMQAYLDAQPVEDPNPTMIGETWGDAEDAAREAYKCAVETLERFAISKGMDKLTARKQARGAARGVLGNALETELVWSANVRALRHYLTLRGNPAADAEIREVAVRLLEIMIEELPVYFNDFIVSPSPDGIGEVITKAFEKLPEIL